MARTAESGGTTRLTVNGRPYSFILGHDLTASETLAEVLRERLGLTGLKVACDEGACGACTVIMDGRAVLSCMIARRRGRRPRGRSPSRASPTTTPWCRPSPASASPGTVRRCSAGSARPAP